MAALVAGVQYGLSSQGNFHENKSLIFVKLTDSAYRAIEDYLRNKNKISQQPTIQFLGNEGQLSFPNPSTNGHGAAFNFSLSGNEDIEGPQGSFECLQSKSKSFEFMGTLPCKMRIQATDDVYAATKQRMAVVEEQQKKNCTRVIKVSDIGRKVKVKKIGSIGALPKRETSPPSYRPPLSTVSVGANKPRNAFSQSRSDVCNNGSSGDSHSTLPNIPHGRIPSGGRTGGNQEIMRRPIRERLIHLLALRPYKKPELYDRIKRDGLRDRDRATLAIVLKQVACMSDNTYHLNRHVWNDVQEDWPFYSEQDKQILKRRKPQNLTPPGSDGSSGSGHSPTSTHPGSPPPTIFPSPSGTNCRLPGPDPSGVKRPGYYDNADGIITKRQRISHYKRPPTESASVTNNNNSSNVQRVRSDSVPRRPQDLPPRPAGSPGHHPSRNRPHPASPGHGRAVARRDEAEALHSPEGGVAATRRVEDEVESGPTKDKSAWPSGKSPEELIKSEERVSEAASSVKGKVVGGEEEGENDRASSEYPDYLTEYTTITTADQRNRYKADFNADYDEYRYLHTIVESVSRRFAELQERLEQEEIGSDAWNNIKDQIVREYQENKRDQQYPEAKKKFQYLHEKLSHIKRLVLEYDSSVSGQIANAQKP